MRRTGIVVAVVTALGLFLAGPAAAQYPPSPTCHLSKTEVEPGDTIGITGENWLPDTDVLLQMFSQAVALGTAHTDQDGAFATSEEIPENTSEGEHTITATGQDQNGDTVTVPCGEIEVEEEAAGAPPAGGGGVAFTGTNVSLGLLILAALILLGAGFTYASRRKKAHADQ